MKKILLSFLMLFAVGTFIAGAQTQVFYESFDKCDGTGGNSIPDGEDNAMSGSAAGTKATVSNLDNAWTIENVYKGDKCVKLGTSSKKGTMTTPEISIDGNATLTFKAGSWENDNTKLVVSISDGTLSQTEFSLANAEFEDYTVQIVGVTDKCTITFAGSVASKERFFLDEVKVVTSSDIAAPTFSPAAGTYYEAQSVTLSAEDGASIYYTTDGEEPTTSSTLYSEAIEVAQTTTIKAIAVKDEVSSAVATATYTIVTATKVASIAEMLEQEDGTLVEFSNPVTAVFQDGQNLYVADESGSAYFYGNLDVKYENGDVIPAGVKGTFEMYYDVPELNVFDTADSFVEATENKGAVEPKAVAVADVTNDLVNQYIKISKVTITSEEDGEYTNYYANSGSDRVWIYSKFSTFTNDALAALEAGKEYDVTGIVTVFKSEPEIYIVSVDETSGVEGVVAEAGVKVLGLDGEIAIVGEAADVEVYNMGGALIAKGNLERVSCPQGIYVVKVDGNVQKVIVK